MRRCPPGDEIQISRFVSNQELLAWAVAVVGLVLLAGCIGYFLGSRTNSGPTFRRSASSACRVDPAQPDEAPIWGSRAMPSLMILCCP